MKKIITYILLLFVLPLVSCEKEVGDTYDFSNSLVPYVELGAAARGKTITVKEGSKVKIQVLVRTALQQPVDITYSVSGALTQQGSLRILRNNVNNNTNVTDSLLVPAGIVPSGSTSVNAVFNLTSAKLVNSSDTLLIGREGREKEKVTLKITK